VYDKFYSRVTFESVKVERGFVNRDTGDISTKRMSSIRIGTDILLSYENLKDDQDEFDYVDINIVYEQALDEFLFAKLWVHLLVMWLWMSSGLHWAWTV